MGNELGKIVNVLFLRRVAVGFHGASSRFVYESRSNLINAWTSRKGRHLQDETSQTQPNHHFPPDSTAARLWFSCHKTIYEITSSRSLDPATMHAAIRPRNGCVKE